MLCIICGRLLNVVVHFVFDQDLGGLCHIQAHDNYKVDGLSLRDRRTLIYKHTYYIIIIYDMAISNGRYKRKAIAILLI